MIGYLYIVHNYEMYGWNTFKIGFTNDLQRRLEDFNSNTINIGTFEDKGHIICKDVELVEKRVHKDLNNFRLRQNREFFSCDFSLANLSIIKNSKDLILENHLKDGYFCTPQGPKYEAFFLKLEEFAKQKKISPPQRPDPNACIGGSFCGCTSYLAKSYQAHFRNWGRVLNWVKINNYQDELDKFLISLGRDDRVICSEAYPKDIGIEY